MKKKLLKTILITSSLFIITSCGTKSENDTPPESKSEVKNLIINTTKEQSKDHPDEKSAPRPSEYSAKDKSDSSESTPLEEQNSQSSYKAKSDTQESTSQVDDNKKEPRKKKNEKTSDKKKIQKEASKDTTPKKEDSFGVQTTSTPDGYISSDGYYHRSSYCPSDSIMTGMILQWHEAREQGYLPCPTCNPS